MISEVFALREKESDEDGKSEKGGKEKETGS